jgi:hypothetical protein
MGNRRYINRERAVMGLRQLRDAARSIARWRVGAVALGLAGILILAGCNLFGGGSSNGNKSLNNLSWCDRQSVSFQDDSTSAQTVLTNWSDVKDQLGFTTYLPTTFPQGTCLDLAGGSIHDPIYGGHFGITYTLPDGTPVAFSEAPKAPNLATKVQCVQSAQDSKTTICLGVIDGTAITIASRQSSSQVQSLFVALQPNVDWFPTTPAPNGTTVPVTTTTPQ